MKASQFCVIQLRGSAIYVKLLILVMMITVYNILEEACINFLNLTFKTQEIFAKNTILMLIFRDCLETGQFTDYQKQTHSTRAQEGLKFLVFSF